MATCSTDLVRRAFDVRLVPSLVMVAIYPPGINACFLEHLDNPTNDGRMLTAVYYANPGWRPEYGGALRAWPCDGASEVIDIGPVDDRLVVFLADSVRHEVLPNLCEAESGAAGARVAYTIWFFIDEDD